MLEELERILAYPRMLKRSGLTAQEIAHYLSDLSERSNLVVPVPVPQDLLRDPRDEPVLGTALAGRAEVLCTRDLHFWDQRVLAFAAEHGTRIMTDLQLLSLLDASPLEPR